MNVADLREFLKDLPSDMEVMLYTAQENGYAHEDVNVAIKDTIVREEYCGSRWVYPESKQRIVEIS
jgi:hypothetical protein